MNKRYEKIMLLGVGVLIIIGIAAAFIYGEYHSRSQYKSNVTNAEQVKGPLQHIEERLVILDKCKREIKIFEYI